jgi:hypothetical protein
MSDIKERVERLYSSVPIIRPPKVIYHFENANWHVPVRDRLDSMDLTGRLMEAGDGEGVVTGWHVPGRDFIVVAASDGEGVDRAIMHESIHYNGLRSERATHMLDGIMQRRANLNLGILKKQIRYDEVPIERDETAALIRQFGRVMHDRGYETVLCIDGDEPKVTKLVRRD